MDFVDSTPRRRRVQEDGEDSADPFQSVPRVESIVLPPLGADPSTTCSSPPARQPSFTSSGEPRPAVPTVIPSPPRRTPSASPKAPMRVPPPPTEEIQRIASFAQRRPSQSSLRGSFSTTPRGLPPADLPGSSAPGGEPDQSTKQQLAVSRRDGNTRDLQGSEEHRRAMASRVQDLERQLEAKAVEIAALKEQTAAEDKLRRGLELQQQQHASANQRLRGDLDSQKKLAAQQKAELEEYAAQQEKEQRASEELRRENQRLQDRQRMIDDHRRDLSAMKDELQRRTAEWEQEKQARVTLEEACSAKQQEIDRLSRVRSGFFAEQIELHRRCTLAEEELQRAIAELQAVQERCYMRESSLDAELKLLHNDHRLLVADHHQLARLAESTTALVDKRIAVDAVLGLEQHQLFICAIDHWAASVCESLSRRCSDAQRESDSLAQEVARNTAELQRCRAALGQSSNLITEAREELTSLYARYKHECDEHDATRMELMKLERQVATHVAAASPSPSRPDGGLAVVYVPHSSAHNVAFVMSTRAELMRHVAEINVQLRDAVGLMSPLLGASSPPHAQLAAPEAARSLASAFEHLNAAHTRCESVLETLFTDKERWPSSGSAQHVDPCTK